MLRKSLKKPYYETIDELPMRNWLECNKGNFGYLYREPKDIKLNDKVRELWQKLYDEFILEIGLTPDYLDLLSAMKRHGLAIIDWMVKQDSLSKTKMAAAESEIESMVQSGGKGGKFSHFVASVEKYMGIQIDLNVVSVTKFYSYVKLMEQEVKNG